MLVYQFVDRAVAYFEYQTSTSITQEFVTSLAFPAVTICSYNRWAFNTLLLFQQKEIHFVKAFRFYLDTTNRRTLNALHLLNQLITPENVAENLVKESRVNLTEIEFFDDKMNVVTLLERHGFSLKESMPRCKWVLLKFWDFDSPTHVRHRG